MNSTKECIMWFRQDLRLTDNPALQHAVSIGKIIPIFIFDDTNPKDWQLGGASKWWLHHSLVSLNESLKNNLVIFKGDPLDIIPNLMEKTGIQSIAWNRCYEPWQIKRDNKLKEALNNSSITVQSFNGSLLWEPGTVLKKDGTPYKVFTPYYRKGCLTKSQPTPPKAKPKVIKYAEIDIESLGIQDLSLIPKIDWYSQIEKEWIPGEKGAAKNLRLFLAENVRQYKSGRDIPEIKSTSRLSPHLHFGELSPNQVWHSAISELAPNIEHPDLDCFLSELGWREFSYYLLYHFPTLPSENFQPKFNRFKWLRSKKSLQAWQQGKTGIPIIDAGMRELWQTGYMHNRVRMIVGSFLVKNLLIHWKYGAEWFWDCLLDADLASNSASWQWVAGSGADAAPYFRIFNPVTQGEKFDTNGSYVKHYCPELTRLPNKYIHKPWEASEAILADANIELGKDYPKPIVDLKTSRQRALDAFSDLKNSG